MTDVIITGILSGILILTQPIIAPLILVFLITLVIKKNYTKSIIILFLICIVMTPWVIRNYNSFGRFIPTKSAIWSNIYVGIKTEEYPLIANDKDMLTQSRRIDSLDAKMNDVVMQKEFKQFVVKFVQEHPGDYLKSCTERLIQYWSIPKNYFNNSDVKFLLVRTIPVFILNILFIFGIFILWRMNRKYAIIIISVLIYFTIVYSITHATNIRFKLDIEWIEFLSAAAVFHKYFFKNIPVRT
jgi:hypothetical protein